MVRRIALSALQQRNFLTGTGRYIAELFRALPAAGPEEEFLLYLKPSQRDLYPEGGPNGRQRVMEGCPDSPLRRILWEWRNFCRQLREDDVALYHGPSNFLPPRKVCPYVLTLHDMIYFRNPARTGRIKAKYWHYYTYATWRQADLILTVSEYSADEIQRFLPVPREKIRVVYNGVHPDYFVPAPEETRRTMREAAGLVDRPYVLYVGRLDPDKNLPRLIRAFARLVESGNRDHVLVLAGARDHRSDELPALAGELGISDRVIFPGYLAQEHLTSAYQEADVFCYPSLNEGFGLPVAEAMAGGAPVVTSNSSSIPEVAGEAAILVNPESVEELAAGLAEALRPERKKELSEAGRERARRFTWEKAARETLEAYEEVLAR